MHEILHLFNKCVFEGGHHHYRISLASSKLVEEVKNLSKVIKITCLRRGCLNKFENLKYREAE